MFRSTSEVLSTSGVKQGDNLAVVLFIFSIVLFIFSIYAVSNYLDKKWEFTTPDFRWYPHTQVGSKPRGQFRGTKHSSKGTMFSFFKSYREVIAASKLIVSHFRRFGLTIHTGSRRKNEKTRSQKRRPFTFQGLDRNHWLLIWRTTTAFCPSASSSNT
jgi:hypothetical protein